MESIVKIMGLPRAGTNAINVLANLNFNNYVCNLRYGQIDFLGWKHSYAPNIDTINLIEKRSNIEIKFIFCFRDYEDWFDAINKRYSGSNKSSEFLDISFGYDGFLFNTPLGIEMYENVYDFYIKRVNSYIEFCNLHSNKGILINYNELKDQEKLLDKLKDNLSLEKSFDTYTYLKKKISFNNEVTSIKI